MALAGTRGSGLSFSNLLRNFARASRVFASAARIIWVLKATAGEVVMGKHGVVNYRWHPKTTIIGYFAGNFALPFTFGL